MRGMYLARQALFDHAVDQAVDDAQSGAAAAEAHDALLGDLLGRLALRPERRQNTGQRDRAGALHDVTPTLFIGQFQKRGVVCVCVCYLNVVVEAEMPVSVLLEQVRCVGVAEVLELDQARGPPQLHGVHEFLDHVVVVLTVTAHTHIEPIDH